jgi:hypothetical protein
MLRVATLLMMIACGGSKPPPQSAAGPCQATCNETGATALASNDCMSCKRAAGLLTCEERCTFESEWYVGCLSACRGHEQRPWFGTDAGLGSFTGDAGFLQLGGDGGVHLFGEPRD